MDDQSNKGNEEQCAVDSSVVIPKDTLLTGWYLEQPRCHEIVAGKYRLRAHWKGMGIESEIRSVMQMAVAAPALYAELMRARDTFTDLEKFLRMIGRVPSADACQVARESLSAALALADGQDTNTASGTTDQDPVK